MPTQGDATSAEAQDIFTTVLQTAATADGNGAVADVAGLDGALMLEINNSGTGTTTLVLEGSFDGVTWYACGYSQVDSQSNIVRNAGAIAVGATSNHVYSVLDSYLRLRGRLTGSAGSPVVTATVRGMAQ